MRKLKFQKQIWQSFSLILLIFCLYLFNLYYLFLLLNKLFSFRILHPYLQALWTSTNLNRVKWLLLLNVGNCLIFFLYIFNFLKLQWFIIVYWTFSQPAPSHIFTSHFFNIFEVVIVTTWCCSLCQKMVKHLLFIFIGNWYKILINYTVLSKALLTFQLAMSLFL